MTQIFPARFYAVVQHRWLRLMCLMGCLLALWSPGLHAQAAAGSWEQVGELPSLAVGSALYTSLVFGPDDQPYVAYRDGANGGKASVMRLNSASDTWEFVGGAGFSAGEALYTSLAFGPDDKPYVGYRDVANGDKATVMRLNNTGDAWEVVGGAGFTAGLAEYTALAFSADGMPYLAYQDRANGSKASVMRLNSAGNAWEVVGGGGFSAGGANYTSLAFGPDGKLYVAYSDVANSSKTSVMRLNSAGNAWEFAGGAGFSAGMASYVSLAFGPDGRPYVGYMDVANSSKTSVMRLNIAGDAWEVVGGVGFSASTVSFTSLAFGPDGKPYVAYLDLAYAGRASLMRLNSAGNAWELVGGAGFSARRADYTSLAFGADGKPYVAYSDVANGQKLAVMRWTEAVAASQSISFPAQTMANRAFSVGATFEIAPLAVASSGLPVSYESATPGICMVSGTTVTMVSLGSCAVVARQAGDTNWLAAPDAAQSISFSAITSQSISFPAQTTMTRRFEAGSSFDIEPEAVASSGLAVSYQSSTSGVCTVSGKSVTMVSAGTCTLEAGQAGNAQWQAAPAVSRSISFAANSVWSGPMTGMAGDVQVGFSGASASCSVVPAQTGFSEASEAMQAALQAQRPGATLPGGAFAFRAEGCAGDTLSVQLTFPEPVSAEAQFLKWGPSANGQPNSWFDPGVQVSGDRTVVSYTVTDDGAGDLETTESGVILDPFAIVQPAAIVVEAITPTAVPTMHEWMLLLMAGAAALMGARVLRRKA